MRYPLTRQGTVNARNVHGGVDLIAPVGTPVVAASRGVVVRVFDHEGDTGNGVLLRSLEDGAYEMYAHLERPPQLERGATVSEGQQLGTVGLTGNTTGPHLHWDRRPTPRSGGRRPELIPLAQRLRAELGARRMATREQLIAQGRTLSREVTAFAWPRAVLEDSSEADRIRLRHLRETYQEGTMLNIRNAANFIQSGEDARAETALRLASIYWASFTMTVRRINIRAAETPLEQAQRMLGEVATDVHDLAADAGEGLAAQSGNITLALVAAAALALVLALR